LTVKTGLQVLIDPSLDEAAEAVKDGLAKRRVLLIIGNCWVDYRGRASSKLEPGERIVIVKEDGETPGTGDTGGTGDKSDAVPGYSVLI